MRAMAGGILTQNGISTIELLRSRGNSQQTLHRAARQQRDARFGKTVFVRAVVELSSFCRQNCNYCGMRRDNRNLDRYRLSLDQLLDIIVHHRPAVITDIDIQAGEDPVAVRNIVLPLIRQLRRQTNLGITICLGTLSRREFDELREAGADYCVLKIETGDAAHYRQILAPGAFRQRLEAIRYLAATGWSVSSGIIVGLPGQADEMILNSLELMTTLPLVGASVSPFIAGHDTPYAAQPNGDLELTLNCVAVMRLAAPHWIIPAVSAMKMVGHDGYARALNAGANLTTINLTPTECRSQYPIYRRDRFIMDEERVLSAIDRAGCSPSTLSISNHLRTRPALTTR
jgi:biotin synthase